MGKEMLKQNKILRLLYSKFIEIMKAYFPKSRAKIAYYIAYGKKCNLNNPKTFSEKLLWLSLNTYRSNSIVLECSDKYLVREYVKERGCEEILNDLYFVWEDIEQIDFGNLPNKFALKLSQGCTTNVLCKNKSELDLNKVKINMQDWKNGQKHYDYMMAKIGGIRIADLKKYYICEKFLESEDGKVPTDYKIYCFNGIPKAILVISDRFGEKKGMFMNPDWTFLSNLNNQYQMPTQTLEKPKSLDKMIEVAKKLSEPFPFVRVDLYDVSGEAVFGELTFFPNGCINMQETEIDGISMGEILDISAEISKSQGMLGSTL